MMQNFVYQRIISSDKHDDHANRDDNANEVVVQ